MQAFDETSHLIGQILGIACLGAIEDNSGPCMSPFIVYHDGHQVRLSSPPAQFPSNLLAGIIQDLIIIIAKMEPRNDVIPLDLICVLGILDTRLKVETMQWYSSRLFISEVQAAG